MPLNAYLRRWLLYHVHCVFCALHHNKKKSKCGGLRLTISGVPQGFTRVLTHLCGPDHALSRSTTILEALDTAVPALSGPVDKVGGRNLPVKFPRGGSS